MEKAKLIYFGDPMCSWCWGIANNLEQVKTAFADRVDFELVLGGLRPGGGDAWDGKMKEFLRTHWKHVHEASGQPFNYDLLEWDEFNYDTEPSCRAVRVVRDIHPQKEFAFFHAVQHKFYVDNEDPTKIGFYKPICDELEIPFAAFEVKFDSCEYEKKVQDDFMKSQQYGIRGYPSVAVISGETGHLIANGYATLQELSDRIEHILNAETAQ